LLVEHDSILPINHGFRRARRVRRVPYLAVASVVCLGFFGYTRFCTPARQQVQTERNPAYLIHASNGAVASEHISCSEIGVDVLKDGGNAVDAAIAATFCTGVVNMFS